MANSKKVLVLIKKRDEQDTRWSICSTVRTVTGITIRWKEGDSFPLFVKSQDIEAMRSAGLSVEEVTE